MSSLKTPCVCSSGHIFSPMIMKLVRMFVWIKPWTSWKMGHVRSKTRSPGQTFCMLPRPFSVIIKFDQHVCLHEISLKFENGLCLVKNLVTRPNLRKSLCMLLRPHFQAIIMKLGENVCLDESRTSLS